MQPQYDPLTGRVVRLPSGANASARTGVVYVSATGNDGNDGSTWAKAFATIGAAFIAVGANGTVVVGYGTFPITSAVTIDLLGALIGTGMKLIIRLTV